MLTFEDINNRNRKFWEIQTELLLERVSDPVLFEIAAREMDSDQRRAVPIGYRKTLETLLEGAERIGRLFYKRFQTEFSRKGGRAPKPDALTKRMMELVARNPTVTESQVLKRVKEDHEFEVGEEDIVFLGRNGVEKSVPISGLKHRLSRIKKQTRSR